MAARIDSIVISELAATDLIMLRFSNTKSSMLYNLLSMGEAQMFLLDVVLDKNPVQYILCQCQLSNIIMSVHFYTGTT